MPTDTGESPLAAMRDWVETTCPKCGGKAERETDTMPQWAGSSWYFLRYIDPDNDKEFASKEALEYWMPVDWYNGGMEHTTLHLLYSRFWHKFLYDQNLVPCDEPYKKRTSHGMILGLNPRSFVNQTAEEQKRLIAQYGSEKEARKALVEKFGEMAEHPVVKMSKSLGNVVNPDDVVNDYGADTLRTYEMFIGAFDVSAGWSMEGVKGSRRFLDRVWKLQDMLIDGDTYRAEFETKMHQTIKKVSNDFESLKFNTAIAAMMALVNEFFKVESVTKAEYATLLLLLNPVAPHMTEELWEMHFGNGRIYQQKWPEYDEAKTVESTVEIAVQINGKVKATLMVGLDEDEASVKEKAHAVPVIAELTAGKNIVKEIYVKGRILNIVAK